MCDKLGSVQFVYLHLLSNKFNMLWCLKNSQSFLSLIDLQFCTNISLENTIFNLHLIILYFLKIKSLDSQFLHRTSLNTVATSVS